MTVTTIDAEAQVATPATPAPAAEPAPPAEPEVQTTEPAATGDGLDSLPESWQAEVKALRAENARRRTGEKELRDQLDGAKTQADIDAAVESYRDQLRSLERDLAIERHTKGLAPELVEFVTGETEDEIKASAEKLRAAFEAQAPPAQEDKYGQKRGGIAPEPGAVGSEDPGTLARAARSRTRRF